MIEDQIELEQLKEEFDRMSEEEKKDAIEFAQEQVFYHYKLWKHTNKKDMIAFFEAIARKEEFLTSFTPSTISNTDGFTMIDKEFRRIDVTEWLEETNEDLESEFQQFDEFECECGGYAVFDKGGDSLVCESCGKAVKPFKED